MRCALFPPSKAATWSTQCASRFACLYETRQSLWTLQRQTTSRQARGERNFELCGRSSRRIGSGNVSKSTAASVVGGRRVYVCIYRHLVNTCTSQTGPLRVKDNQLLPPPPGLYLPPLVRLQLLPLQEQATRRDATMPCRTLLNLDLTSFEILC